jgi:hypothetical protein
MKFEFSKIEKLVDGELSHADRSSLLDAIPNGSDHWKHIALAFVEKQIFDESMAEVFSDSPPSKQHSLAAKSFVSDGEARDDRMRLHAVRWLAGLAACLLLGVFIGSSLFATGNFSLTQNRNPTGIGPATELRPSPAEEANSIGLAEALSRSGSPVPAEFQLALRRAGYSYADEQVMTEVSLPDGGAIEIPVRKVRVEYVGLNSFQ